MKDDDHDNPSQDAPIRQGFENNCILVKLEQLLPGKAIPKTVKSSRKYKQIAISIGEVGLVEPPVVARNPDNAGSFFILDGHLRIEVLKDLGHTEVECLVSTDDEAFTYNKQVNRLASVQEYAMIVNALNQGVPEDRIAKVLSVNVSTIRRRSRMLNGVCPEATELLKDKNCPMAMFEILKKMQPLRQIEAADLMINANNYSVAYASAILAGTPRNQLAEPDKPKSIRGMTADAIARMEKELSRLQEGMTSIQDTYGKDHLELTVVKGYLKRLLGNSRVVSYLIVNRPEYVPEFQSIVDITSTIPSEG
ncbi:ParB N-terminal domain-containing protein [Agrobacterium rhizogenes]|uniref:plasmid partitioning protein RepB C-terminal domain-containing protein n=1 Tax=Rhizobium rhizogenes TaxID=359 RepID=UPI001571722B|nr:plasmid partitioning protein RepB C-terminal domain-containing protein [Rhizobium rhizogenes]NTH16464.1 ParB N-terminal domain-containing protein [Rhizobium rhizogenes]NTI78414.1 ParB N-terminal domain-containing protein [Rhizobium rhizogenes]